MAAQHLVKRGLRWQVGDGRSIWVWQDQWLTTRSTYRVVTPERHGNQIKMVRDLLKDEGMEWDIELVRGLFLPQDAEAILIIPISESDAKDRMVWAKDKKGKFTIRSAYRLAREIEAEGGNTSCSNPTKMHGVWRGVWSMNLPNKIKHFAWKSCNGILPIKDSLFRRKIMANNICEVCGRQVETIMHMLCFCSRGTEVWSSSKLTLPCNVQESWSFVDTFSRLRVSWEAQQGLLERWVTICWGIWKSRNEVQRRPSLVIVRSSLKLLEDFQSAKEKLRLSLDWAENQCVCICVFFFFSCVF